jgi:hypothetical protein
MEAVVFVKQHNSTTYDNLGAKKFSFLPRVDEFISVGSEDSKIFYQVIAVHHAMDPKLTIEVYAIHTEPTWEWKKKRAIGFGS